MGKLKVILSTTAGGGSVSGVQSVTGDGVDNTSPENPVVSFPNQSEVQAIRPLKTVNNESLEGTGNITIDAGGSINSVTGDGVGGTAEDVVLSFPNADEVDDSSTTNKFLTQTEKDKIAQNESFIALLQDNKADQSEVDSLSSRVGDNENSISDLQVNKADRSELTDLDVRVGENSIEISDNTNRISDLETLKANQSDLDSLDARVVNNSIAISDLQINKANQSDLDNLGNDVSNNAQSILDLDGRVSQNETDISDKIDISTVASATEKGGMFFEWDSANDIMTIDNQPL